MKRCNVFIVHTEYHVFLTVNIICGRFFDYENHVYMTQGSRLLELKSIHITDTTVHFLSQDTSIKAVLHEIEALKPERFFFFQDNSANNMYLCYNLSKKGTTIALVQDGLKPYVFWNKRHKVLSTIKDTLNTYSVLIKQHAMVPSLVWMNYYDYGDWRFVNELWLTNPDAFVNKHQKKLVKIPDFTNQSLSILNETFNYEGDEELRSVILILGQPTANSQNWSFDASLVQEIVKRFPYNKIWYKPHPLTNPDHLEMIKSIKQDNFHFYTKKIPAELLILQLSDSIVISRNSTAMLTYNHRCNYFWTYQLYPEDILSSQYEMSNPTSYIIEIKSIDEISF